MILANIQGLFPERMDAIWVVYLRLCIPRLVIHINAHPGLASGESCVGTGVPL